MMTTIKRHKNNLFELLHDDGSKYVTVQRYTWHDPYSPIGPPQLIRRNKYYSMEDSNARKKRSMLPLIKRYMAECKNAKF